MLDSIIENSINKLKHDDIKNFALKEKITLNEEEIDIIYSYIKIHWKTFLHDNPTHLMNELKKSLRKEVYLKLEALYLEYKSKLGQ